MTPEVLKENLEAGKTLLEIDQAEGTTQHASADDLATTLLAPIQTMLDAAVKNSQLTATQASIAYTGLHSRMVTLVTTPHPFKQLPAGKRADSALSGSDGSIR